MPKYYNPEIEQHAKKHGLSRKITRKSITRLTADRMKTLNALRKQNAYAFDIFEATGYINLSLLNGPMLEKDDQLYHEIRLYHYIKQPDPLDEKDVSLIEGVLQPDRRAKLLEHLLQRAEQTKDKSLYNTVIGAGFQFHIHEPLIRRADHMGIKNHFALLTDMIYVARKTQKNPYTQDIFLQFDNLEHRLETEAGGAELWKSEMYRDMYDAHPLPEKRQDYYRHIDDSIPDIRPGERKDKLILFLREKAEDEKMRAEKHALFIENAQFQSLIADALNLKQTTMPTKITFLQQSLVMIRKQKDLPHNQVVFAKNRTALSRETQGLFDF